MWTLKSSLSGLLVAHELSITDPEYTAAMKQIGVICAHILRTSNPLVDEIDEVEHRRLSIETFDKYVKISADRIKVDNPQILDLTLAEFAQQTFGGDFTHSTSSLATELVRNCLKEAVVLHDVLTILDNRYDESTLTYATLVETLFQFYMADYIESNVPEITLDSKADPIEYVKHVVQAIHDPKSYNSVTINDNEVGENDILKSPLLSYLEYQNECYDLFEGAEWCAEPTQHMSGDIDSLVSEDL